MGNILLLIGVIIGAVLQFCFIRNIEYNRHLRELKSKIYLDYLKDVAKSTQNLSDNERDKLNASLVYAVASICLYGSNNVIEEYANFNKAGGLTEVGKGQKEFIKMVNEMRKDLGRKLILDHDNISYILFRERCP